MPETKKSTAAKWIWLSVIALVILLAVLMAQVLAAFFAGLNALGDAASGTAESIFPLRKN